MPVIQRAFVSLLLVSVIVACQGGGAEPSAIAAPTAATTGATPTPPALRPVVATSAAPEATMPASIAAGGPNAEPTADPFQDEATLLVLSQLEADTTALIEFMNSDPARQAMLGGIYIEHPSGVQLGAPDSTNVLQLVATQAEADALLAQLPPLTYPDRLQIELVTCSEAHLNELMAQRRPAFDAAGMMLSQYVDSKANRVGVVIKASADYTVVNGLIDKRTLPPDIATELADPCLVVLPMAGTLIVGNDPLDGTSWQLISAPGQAATLERLGTERAPRLTFADGALMFTTGCNNPSGYYGIDGENLTSAGVLMRLVNCSDTLGEDGMALEQALADATATFSTFALAGDELRIGYADGELLFRRLP
jgi:heat shock protein HslJ